MPYVKSISVHSTPEKTIRYILNPDKTEDLLFVSGQNCSTTAKIVYEEMKSVFNAYSKRSKFDETKAINSKTPVKLHHFVQSFSPTESVTPETVHKIANEWAEKAFGKDRQILIATHVDKGHIHSHIVINPYDLNGKKYNSNKRTLQQVRDLSDVIARQYGLSVIDKKPVTKKTDYKEWDSKRKGTSWKQQIKDSIDRLVYEVSSKDELFQKLSEQGYEIKRGQHTTISIPTAEGERKKAVRIDNIKSFGEGYSDEELDRRIELAKAQKAQDEMRKEYEEQQKTMSPMEQLYTKRIYEVGRLARSGQKVARKFAKKLPYSVENDYEVYRMAQQLEIIKRDGIQNISHLQNMISDVNTVFEDTRKELNNVGDFQKQLELVIERYDLYKKLSAVPPKELSQAERLKLNNAELIVKQSGVKSDGDVEKLLRAYADNQQKIRALNEQYAELEKRFAEYTDIVEKYKEISQGDYVSRLIEEKKRQDRKNSLQ